MTSTAPDTITWSDMTAAGIDADRVSRIQNTADTSLPMWRAVSADGTWRITFGICLDPNAVVPEGEHTGWDAFSESLASDSTDDEPAWDAGTQDYFEPEDVAGLLATVAKVAPIA